MIATAFIENDVNKILDAGIAAIDPKSNTLKRMFWKYKNRVKERISE
jgi:ribosome-associated translation inhibitor RaiA